jgi:cytochrome c-type biogenesis protein CcmF
VGSGSFDESDQVVLRPGIGQDISGYRLTFRGVSASTDGKTQMNIEVSDGRSSFLATPKLYYSEYNRSMLREPDIKIYPLRDLYLSPLELRTSDPGQDEISMDLVKGEKKTLGGYEIEFVQFETGEHRQTGQMAVGALLNVTAGGKKHAVMPQVVLNERGEQQLMSADMPGMQFPTKGVEKPKVRLMAMKVEQRRILLSFSGLSHRATQTAVQELIVEVSTKPLMMVVWTGVVLLIGGTAIALRRRIARSNEN